VATISPEADERGISRPGAVVHALAPLRLVLSLAAVTASVVVALIPLGRDRLRPRPAARGVLP
jgi:hypothetical protein